MRENPTIKTRATRQRMVTAKAFFVGFMVFVAGDAFAQNPPQIVEQKVVPDDPSATAQFGSAVAVDSIFALIGSSRDDSLGVNAGSAYLYGVSDSVWTQRQKILADDAASGDEFGAAVSLSRSVAVVGSPGRDAEQGGVYVFRESAGLLTLEQTLVADDGAVGDRFGDDLSVDGGVLVVGSAGHDLPGIEGSGDLIDAGAAYVYRFDGSVWTQEALLISPDSTSGDLFGVSVGVYGNVIAVGASRNDSTGTDAGAVYVYRFAGGSWLFEQKLVADDGFAFDFLGISVAVADSVVLAGAYGDDSKGRNAGSAYIFRRDSTEWVQEIRLLAGDPQRTDQFGLTVSLTDTLAVIGSHWNAEKGPFSGAAYVFEHQPSGWTQIQKLTADDGAELDLFGASVAVGGFTAFVGAPRNDDNATDSGSAYFYTIPRPEPPPSVVAVENPPDELPSTFRIVSVFPNPFRGHANIEIEIERASPIELSIYNIVGQQVARLTREFAPAGRTVIGWDPGRLAAGVYLIRMRSRNRSAISKVVLLR